MTDATGTSASNFETMAGNVSHAPLVEALPGMTTTRRSIRYSGHTKHTFYCSCGRQVSGNGGKQHFKLDGHRRIGWDQWKATQ